jgi:integrase
MKYTSAMLREVKSKSGKRWKGILKYKDDGGKWRQVAKTFGADVRTKTAANKALQQWRDQMERDAEKQGLPSADTTVSEYVTAYIDTIEAAGTVRPSAISDYRTSCKRISEGIGDVKLADLTPAMIQAWEAKLLKSGKSVNTVLKYHRLLNSVCKHAISVRDLDWNPCTAVKKPKRVAPSPNSLDANQHARLSATLNVMGATPTVTAATIALYTGMREGEICGLKWKCYDAKSGIIHVERAIAKAGGKKYETTPKTEAGRRDIPVHPDLADMLSRRRERMVNELQEAGITLNDAEFGELYVCGAIDGRYLDTTILSRSWKSLAESFELMGTQGRRVTFHDLRHSFATRAIANGADVKAVAAVLGHADAHVTLNVYADADKESKARAVALVGYGIQQQGDVKPFAELGATTD